MTEGVAQGMGIDLKAMIAGMIGGKIASDPAPTTVVVEAPPAKEPSETKGNGSKDDKT